MPPRIVVTGSSGFLGTAVVAHLRAVGHDVLAIDRRSSPTADVVGDLATLELDRWLAGAMAVVHLAALHAPHVGRHTDEEFRAANVVATDRLLRAAERVGLERFVFASSTSVYGHALAAADRAVWVDESLPTLPRDVYDVTKLEAEGLVAVSTGSVPATVTLRVGRCFVEPWRTTAVNRLHRGVDRRDVVDAFERAVTTPIAGHATLNIAGPRIFQPVDLPELKSDPAAVLSRRAPGIVEEFRRRGWDLPAALDRVYVSDLAATVLGYRPRYGVREVLAADPAG